MRFEVRGVGVSLRGTETLEKAIKQKARYPQHRLVIWQINETTEMGKRTQMVVG